MAGGATESPGRRVAAAGASGGVPAAAALAAMLGVLGLLAYYFATRPESDWVLVIAMALCIAAVAFRLVRLVGPGRSK